MQDPTSAREVEPLVVQYLSGTPDSEVWILWVGKHTLSRGKRRRMITGWEVIIQDLPFLRSEHWQHNIRYELGRKFLAKALLELFGKLPPKKRWRPPLLREAFLSIPRKRLG